MAKKDYHKKTPERAEYMSKYAVEWKKKNSKAVMLYFNLRADADILAMLDSVPSKLVYIRSLIRQDMADRGISFGTEDSDDED